MCLPFLLLHPNSMVLMPLINTNIAIESLEHLLLPLWPPNPLWLTVSSHTNYLLRNRQLGIDSRCEWVDQFWPGLIPEPEHRRAVAAERALGGDFLLLWCAAVFESCVFSTSRLSLCFTSRSTKEFEIREWYYLIKSFPLMIFRLDAIPPRFTLPPVPPHFLQILQAQS